jgi:hypothetical protein
MKPILINDRPRLIEVVSAEEWERVRNQKFGHRDAAEAIQMLAGKKAVRVKFKCPEGMQHKKRESARQMADRLGLLITTKYTDGWLYIARVLKPEAAE